MSQVQFTFIARAIAFAGTAEEKVFDVPFKQVDQADECLVLATSNAQAYEAENAQVALFAQIEAAQGKKLTKPQRELLALTLSIQGGTYKDEPELKTTPEVKQSEDKSVETKTVQPESETVETTQEAVDEPTTSEEAVQETTKTAEPVADAVKEEPVDADKVVQQAIAENDAEVGNTDTNDAVEDALAALGL